MSYKYYNEELFEDCEKWYEDKLAQLVKQFWRQDPEKKHLFQSINWTERDIKFTQFLGDRDVRSHFKNNKCSMWYEQMEKWYTMMLTPEAHRSVTVQNILENLGKIFHGVEEAWNEQEQKKLVPSSEDCLEYYKINLQKFITSFQHDGNLEYTYGSNKWSCKWTPYDITFTKFLGSLAEFPYENTSMLYLQMQQWCSMMAVLETSESRLREVNQILANLGQEATQKWKSTLECEKDTSMAQVCPEKRPRARCSSCAKRPLPHVQSNCTNPYVVFSRPKNQGPKNHGFITNNAHQCSTGAWGGLSSEWGRRSGPAN